MRTAPHDFGVVEIGVVRQHRHAKRACQARDALAGMAQADQADGLAREFVAHHLFAGEAALAAHAGIALDDAPGDREHEADGHLGHRDRVAAGLVDQ